MHSQDADRLIDNDNCLVNGWSDGTEHNLAEVSREPEFNSLKYPRAQLKMTVPRERQTLLREVGGPSIVCVCTLNC